MYLSILKGDFKKNKYKNLLILFLLSISMIQLILCWALLYSSTKEVDDFIAVSKVSDLIGWKSYDEKDIEKLKSMVHQYSFIEGYSLEQSLPLKKESISFGERNIEKNFSIFLSEYFGENNKVFDEQDCEIQGIKEKEIAIPISISKEIGLIRGDKVEIEINGNKYNFIVGEIFKDALFGSDYVSTKRILINEIDFRCINKSINPDKKFELIGFRINKNDDLRNLVDVCAISGIKFDYTIDKPLLKQIYLASNGVLSVILMVLALFTFGICIYIQKYITKVDLKYNWESILFMKATGLSLNHIKYIYGIKYLAISIFSLMVSYPIVYFLYSKINYLHREYVVEHNIHLKYGSALLVGIVVLLVYLYITNMYLNQVKNISPTTIDQKRDLNDVGVLSEYKIFNLFTKNIELSLGLRDLVIYYKSYVKQIIILVFCLFSTMILLSFKQSIESESFVKFFGITYADLYLDLDSGNPHTENISIYAKELNNILISNNEKAHIEVDYYLDTRIMDNEIKMDNIVALKSAANTSSMNIIKGIPPVKENEISITNVLAARCDKDVGDNLELEIMGKKKSFRITAIHQALYNLGEIILLSDDYKVANGKVDYQFIVFVDDEVKDKNVYIQMLKRKYSFMKGKEKKDIVNQMSGNMVGQISTTCNMIAFGLVSFMLLEVFLFNMVLLNDEKKKIIYLKEIGMSDKLIERYFMYRSVIISFISAVVSIALYLMLGKVIFKKIFTIVGISNFILELENLGSIIGCSVVCMFLSFIVSGIAILLSKNHSDKRGDSYGKNIRST